MVNGLRIKPVVSVLASLVLAFTFAGVVTAESPADCGADNSVVNISKDKSVAEVGDMITFSVSAGNPASGDGCDITGRTLTLTLPDGSVSVFGPSNYPNPTVVSTIGSVPYIADAADAADLSGGVWTATVDWDGTLEDIVPQPSIGSKQVSVNEIEPLEVSKTAVPASSVDYRWLIDKSVTPATWDLFDGDSGTSEYTIELTKEAGDQTYSVSGVITIHNPNDVESATVDSVSDVISGYGPADSVVCDEQVPDEAQV